jgi:Xaa-Pro aminopeptidase
MTPPHRLPAAASLQFSPAEFERRRSAICAAVDRPIVLLGHRDVPRNLPAYGYPFRQSSDVLYLTGCNEAGAGALLHDGALTLFLPEAAPGDALWHGPMPGLEARAAGCYCDAVRPIAELEDAVAAALQGGAIATVAVADDRVNQQLSWWTGRPLSFGDVCGDDDLIEALCVLRRRKSDEEIAAMRRAVAISTQAHLAVASATRPGVSERALVALFEAMLAGAGLSPGYATILTQRGEILHCHSHDDVLAAGAMLLVDGGGELGAPYGNAAGYCADLTRTWPVSGRFSPRQAAVYDVVHQAWRASIAAARPGARYRAVHDAAASVIAQFAIDEGLLRVSVEDAVAMGAHGVLFPHGVGHLLGLDVHDLEAYGDRGSYPSDGARPTGFGSRFLRLDLPLEPGFVVTIEPGIYAVDAIFDDAAVRQSLGDAVDWCKLEAWRGFGGIRIEDDVVIADAGVDILSCDLPRGRSEVEAAVGGGMALEALLRVGG